MKLKLKWVTDVIGDEYKKWHEGEVIIIESQTGTGKTHFIKNVLIGSILNHRRNFLLVCNRTNLKRQIKKDLLILNNQEVPSSLEELDRITTIEGTTITSYQAIEETMLDNDYSDNEHGANIRKIYDYIILDECHYVFSDSGFNNKTRLVFDEYIEGYQTAVKVFITATADEIREPIRNYIDAMYPMTKRLLNINLREYSTGIDYSYVNARYFKKIKDLITTIKNDTSDDKWIVFVSKIEDGQAIKEELGEDAVLIKSGTKHAELDSIILNRKFDRKVLIATKALDNGISIEDVRVKNIAIMAWDKITFIQMLGRRRVNIENADTINLYIPVRYSKSFKALLKIYEDKLAKIKLCTEKPNEFCRKYDNDLKGIGEYNEIFYKNKDTKDWTVNPLGEQRVHVDKEFAEYMIQKFQDEGRYAFVREQLSWIGLEDTFEEGNLIENVVPNDERDDLEAYLDELYTSNTVMLNNEDRQELIEKINVRDGNNKNRILKGIHTLNGKLEETGSQFCIQAFETSRTINGKKKRYKNAWRVIRR